MERITQIKDIISVVMEEYVEERAESYKGLECELIKTDSHFQLIIMGWKDEERIYHQLFHIDLKNGKAWIQADNSEVGVANLLVEKGIDKK